MRCAAADADAADAADAGREGSDVAVEGSDAPWNVGIYYTKRCVRSPHTRLRTLRLTQRTPAHPAAARRRPVHRTDAIGGIPEESMDNLVDPPSWDAVRAVAGLRGRWPPLTRRMPAFQSGKLRLAVTIVARDLRLDPSTVYSRLDSLRVLIPDLGARMSTMRAGDLARLAASVTDVAAALIRLRSVFPRANVSAMVAKRPDLLLLPAGEVERRAAALRLLMPGVDADAAAAEQPRLLDVEDTAAALAELSRLMPTMNVVKMLAADTDLLTSVQTGPQLIPYDNGTLAQLKESLTGGPGAAPDGW